MDNQRMMLERQIELLAAQSTDAYYTEYLTKLLQKVRSREVTTEYAIGEVNRTYQLYLQRQQAPVQPVQQPVQQPMQQAMQQPVQQPMQQPIQQPMQQPVQQPVQQPMQPPVMQQMSMQTVRPMQQPMGYPQQSAAQQPVMAKKNMEFAIGAGLLSVVGVLFVLVAFVMLGLTYMSGMVKGLCLYAIALAVLAASELALTRKMPKFAVGITGLGICGLYLSTMLNYLYLHNFNGLVAMGIAVVISLLAVFISRKKDSGTIKIISFIGCYICIFPVGEPFLGVETWNSTAIMHLIVTTVILFLVNLMTLLLPVKKNRAVVHVVHMIANALFSIAFAITATVLMEECSYYILFFLLTALLTQGIIFYKLEKPYFGTTVMDETETGGVVTYLITTILLLATLLVESFYILTIEGQTVVHITAGLFMLICTLLFFMFRKSRMKWLQYWFGSFFTVTLYWLGGTFVQLGVLWTENNEEGAEYIWQWWRLGVILGVFLAAKLLAGKKNLRISELLITVFTALQAIITFASLDLDWYGQVVNQQEVIQNFTASMCFLSAFLLSTIALRYWKSVYEEIIIVVFMSFILLNFQNEMTPALLMGILFMAVVGFNSVEFCRGDKIKVCNYLNLGLAACLYVWIAFLDNSLLYAIMLLLGISFMVLTFREKYGMSFKIKNLIFVLFLCYMTLIWRMPLPIMKSIILVIIAIGAVVAGFVMKEKKLRITGLSLTLAVCGKIVLYDFTGLDNIEKMVLFLTVGLIVLAISGIYIALEKKIV
ncbi:MAG: DUF2339 domain-containing protein [Lachnospiraceae bacterium]